MVKGQGTELEVRDESAEVAVSSGQFSDEELAGVIDFDSAAKLVLAAYGPDEIVRADDLGDGFLKLENKDRLIGVPFIVLGWGTGYSEYGDDTDPDNKFSVLKIVVDQNSAPQLAPYKFRITDGGTGIHKTCMTLFKGNPENFRPIIAEFGLSVGEFTVRNKETGLPAVNENGKRVGKGRTHRFATEPTAL